MSLLGKKKGKVQKKIWVGRVEVFSLPVGKEGGNENMWEKKSLHSILLSSSCNETIASVYQRKKEVRDELEVQ